jgi:hypothetical protein
VKVHIGPIQERVALAENHDVLPGVEVNGQFRRALVVELRHRSLVTTGMIGFSGGDRVAERQLDLTLAQVRRGDLARDATAVLGTGVGDHIGPVDRVAGLNRHQFRVPRTYADADAEQSAGGGHSLGLAIALTAAAAIALPPRRPRTTT